MGKNTAPPRCKLCGEEHPLGRCPKFYKPKAVAEKIREIQPKPSKKKAAKRKAPQPGGKPVQND